MNEKESGFTFLMTMLGCGVLKIPVGATCENGIMQLGLT
jgi:hypothetical protein